MKEIYSYYFRRKSSY